MAERKKAAPKNPENIQRPDRWLKGYYIATWIIALIAITGFIFSIRSSSQISKTLETITASLGAVTYPVFQIDDYQFYVSQRGPITCENSPTGILIAVQNKSNVPIKIYRTASQLFFGKRPIGEDVISPIEGSEESILVPKDPLSFGVLDNQVLREQLRIPGRLLRGPHIEFQFEAEYSRLEGSQRYLYKSHRVIPFDCRNPDFQTSFSREEIIKSIN